MNSIRCGKCALVNFTSSDVCKRCGEPLSSAINDDSYAQPSEFGTNQAQASYETASTSYGYASQQQQGYYGAAQGYPAVKKSKGMGATLLALVCLIALVGIPWYLKSRGANEFANASWRDFKSDDGSFSVSIPGEPKQRSMSMPSPKGNITVTMYYYVTGGGSEFAMGSIDFGPAASDMPVDKLFDKAIESLAARTQVTVLNRKNIMLNGHPGFEVEVKPPASAGKDGEKGVFRFYWAPPRIYMVGIGGPDSPEATAARTKFLDSFKILR